MAQFTSLEKKNSNSLEEGRQHLLEKQLQDLQLQTTATQSSPAMTSLLRHSKGT